jgi:hypothetical protein
VENSFSRLRGPDPLAERTGLPHSRGALNRYGRQFGRRLEAVSAATDHARALTEATSGDEGMATEALIRIVQQRLFSVLIETEGPLRHVDLARLARTIGNLSRTTITHRRWLAECQDRLERQRRAATGKVAAMENAGGLSDEAAQCVRDILLGIDPFAPPLNTREQ